MPASPVTVPVKYSAAKTIASTMRTILSVEPMFFVMAIEILGVKQSNQQGYQRCHAEAQEADDNQFDPF